MRHSILNSHRPMLCLLQLAAFTTLFAVVPSVPTARGELVVDFPLINGGSMIQNFENLHLADAFSMKITTPLGLGPGGQGPGRPAFSFELALKPHYSFPQLMNLVAFGQPVQNFEVQSIRESESGNYGIFEIYEFDTVAFSTFETFVTSSGGNVGGFLTVVPLNDFTVTYFGTNQQGQPEGQSQFTYNVQAQTQLALLNIVPEPSSCVLTAMALSVGCLRRRRQA